MSAAKHTHGPLPVLYLREHHGAMGPLVEVVDMDGAVVKRNLLGFDVVKLTSALEAAAPDLLAAARDAQAAIASNDSQRELALQQAKEQLDAAIAKARNGGDR